MVAVSEGPSVSLVQRLESCTSDHVDATVVQRLESQLAEEARTLDRATREIDATLFSDAFPLVFVLAPLLTSQDPNVAKSARDSLDLLSLHSSGKEMAMALGERLVHLGPPRDESEDGETDSLNLARDKKEKEAHPNEISLSRIESEERELGPWSGERSAQELAILIHLYSKILPRIKTARPQTFLDSTCDNFASCLRNLNRHEAFNSNESEDAHETTHSPLAPLVANAISNFVDILSQNSWIAKSKEECLLCLRRLLIECASILHPLLPNQLAETFFYENYPNYRNPQTDKKRSTEIEEAWKNLLRASDDLELDLKLLYQTVTAPGQEIDANQRIGSFVLLAHKLQREPDLMPKTFGESSSRLLQQTLPLIVQSFTRNSNLAVDETLFFVWFQVESAVKSRENFSETVFFPLVELISSLAAESTFPSTRFLAYRVLTTIILRLVADENFQFMLVKDLLQNCPFPPMKIAAISLLRELLVNKFESVDGAESIFLSPLLLHELSANLIRFEPNNLLADSELSLHQFLESHSRITAEKLSFCYFLLARDTKNQTQLKTNWLATEQNFLGPLRRRLASWQNDATTKMDESLEIALLQNSLNRIDELYERLKFS